MSEQETSSNTFPVVIITGLSGSGKSTALSVMEDMGFFAVDGLPAAFAPQMLEMILRLDLSRYAGVAFGMDLRQSDFLHDFEKTLDDLKKQSFSPYILFFEAKPDILLKRYATTRRPHPLEKEGLGLEQSISQEQKSLSRLRKKADLVLDTSTYSNHDLRRVLQKKWNEVKKIGNNLRVHLISFGFKYGTPSEADMVFDLRFLPNPYFIDALRPLSGMDKPVADFVLEHDPGKEFLARLEDFLGYVLKQYEAEGRFRLTIAIGCTGGRHRSVAISEALARALGEAGYHLSLEHRHFSLG